LLNQIDADVASLTVDGAYDDEAVYDAVAARHPRAEIIIPPRVTSVTVGTTATRRDQHIATVTKHGRMGWQRCSGRRLRARTLPNQRTEAKIGCGVLNRMTALGMPASARIK
jgi:hypothetical protein